MMNSVQFLVSKEDLVQDQGPGLIPQELLCSRVLLKSEKRQKGSEIDIRRGTPSLEGKSAPLTSVSKGVIYFFN